MDFLDHLSINEEGHLTVGGCDTVELAGRFGTPLYVMDETKIRESCRAFLQSIQECYHGNGLPTYACKAFCCKEMCRIIKEEGLALDVCSGGELYTALSVDFPAERIMFHGNNKSETEIRYGLSENVGRFIADNLRELRLISKIGGEIGKTGRVILRIKPGIDAHTHDFIRTGQIDSKFGIAIETGEAFEAVRLALELPNVELMGFHCHIGSQIFELEPFAHAAEVMLQFIAKVRRELDFETRELNLGGGFGIRYTDADTPRPYGDFMKTVSKRVYEVCDKLGISVPRIYIEPGRSIAGPAGLTLYTVGEIKEIPGVRTYVSIDGGMNDNPRYALYKASYDITVANKAAEPRSKTVTVAGQCCESGDLIQEHIALQEARSGDILAVLATGAYNYAMSMNYNRFPRPAVVMVRDGQARVVVRRETYEDVARNDI